MSPPLENTPSYHIVISTGVAKPQKDPAEKWDDLKD
jgi:hypothetical protein